MFAQAIVAAAMTVALVGCGNFLPARPIEVFFPRQLPRPAPAPVLTALASGTLTLDHGCLWLVSPLGRHLLIWAARHQMIWRDGRIAIVQDGRIVAVAGEPVAVGGGEVTSEPGQAGEAWVEALTGEPIPPACRQGFYWLVSGVVD